MNQAIICNKCDTVLVKSIDGEIKVRSKVLIIRDTGVVAVCKGCNNELPVPLALDTSMFKSFSDSTQVRLYVKR